MKNILDFKITDFWFCFFKINSSTYEYNFKNQTSNHLILKNKLSSGYL